MNFILFDVVVAIFTLVACQISDFVCKCQFGKLYCHSSITLKRGYISREHFINWILIKQECWGRLWLISYVWQIYNLLGWKGENKSMGYLSCFETPIKQGPLIDTNLHMPFLYKFENLKIQIFESENRIQTCFLRPGGPIWSDCSGQFRALCGRWVR